MEKLGGKGAHNWALLMKACDSFINPATPEDYDRGWKGYKRKGGGRTKENLIY